MRRIAALVIFGLLSLAAFAQTPPEPSRVLTRAHAQIPPSTPGHPLSRCCPSIYDADGKVMGEMIRWDDRFQSIQLWGWMRYSMKGGDVALLVSPEAIQSVQSPGGSIALFTTHDCSGNTMFAQLGWPPLMKRYSMILPVAPNPGAVGFGATQAWLWVTDPLPSRANPGATVFWSQWGDGGACVPYPAPGYTVSGTPFGGYWMHRVEDLYAKFKRPYYAE